MVKGTEDYEIHVNTGNQDSKPKAQAVPKYLFKILIAGSDSVGKTCLLQRYTNGEFHERYMPTIGIDFNVKQHFLENGDMVKVQAWDVAGQERYRNITTTYYRGAAGLLLVYDVTDNQSFIDTARQLEEVRRMTSENVIIVLVGNKADTDESQREVSFEEGRQYAQEENLPFFETSAKDNINVQETFNHLIHLLVEQYKERHKQKPEGPVAKSTPETVRTPKSKSCAIL